MHVSIAEEKYLKTIYQLTEGDQPVANHELAQALKTSAAATTDMVQKLAKKQLVKYQKYRGVQLSAMGRARALALWRSHMLWSVFLVQKLQLGVGESQKWAEQLAHVQEPMLLERLDHFLDHPPCSPQGKPIPNAQGKVPAVRSTKLTSLPEGGQGTVLAIQSEDPTLLQYLHKRGISLGVKVHIMECIAFDQSVEVSINDHPPVNLAHKASSCLLVGL